MLKRMRRIGLFVLAIAVIFHIDYKKVPNKILNEKTRKN